MNHLRNGYLARYFKTFHFIPTLFIAGILCTIFIGAEVYHVFDKLSIDNFTYYLISFAGFFSVIYLIYALAECKRKKLTIADSANFAILITCIAYILYVALIAKTFSPLKLIVVGAFIIITGFTTVMRTVYFNPYDDKGKVYYTKHSINAYYHTLVKNYSFYGILLFSLGLSCLSHMIISSGYVINLNSPYVVAPIIVSGLFLSLLIINSISKKIGVLDAAILGLTLTIVPALLQILLLVSSPEKKDVYLIYWSIIVGIVLILTLLRYIFFDISKIGKNTSESFGNKPFVSYFKKVSQKYGLGIILTAAFVEISVYLLINKFAKISNFFNFENGELLIKFNLFPCILVNLLFFGTVFISVILSISNLKAIKITFADFLTLSTLVFSLVLASLLFLTKAYNWKIYCLLAIAIYCVIITIFRIIRVCPKRID